MHSTHTMSLEVLAGVLPLKSRFWDLSSRLLIKCEALNPLVIENFERLVELQLQSRYMTVYFNHMAQNINPSNESPHRVISLDTSGSTVSFDTSMLQETRGIPDHLRVHQIPKIFFEKYQHINRDKMFYTDGSLLNESTGFGIFNTNLAVSYKLDNPASVYVAELAAIQYTLGIIENMPTDHYFIFTDSLSSIEALRSMRNEKHSPYFLGKIRERLSALSEKSSKITLAWVPSHCSIPGNEKADSLAKVGATNGDIFKRPISYHEFFSLSRRMTVAGWQTLWDRGELGRWLHSIIPQVSTKAWFKGLDVGRDFIRVMSRLMSNHYRLDAHLRRIGLTDCGLCACEEGYHDVEHVVWACVGYRDARSQLLDTLRAREMQPYVPVRDILGKRDLPYMLLVYEFLKRINLKV